MRGERESGNWEEGIGKWEKGGGKWEKLSNSILELKTPTTPHSSPIVFIPRFLSSSLQRSLFLNVILESTETILYNYS